MNKSDQEPKLEIESMSKKQNDENLVIKIRNTNKSLVSKPGN